MRLYHGSNVDIQKIELSKCRPNKDFGKGFYLTSIKEQAERMALRVSKMYGGTPFVNIYSFNEKVLIWSDPQCDGAEKKHDRSAVRKCQRYRRTGI